MHRRGGPNVAIAFGPGGPLMAHLRAVDSSGGPVSWGDRRKRDSTTATKFACSVFPRIKIKQIQTSSPTFPLLCICRDDCMTLKLVDAVSVPPPNPQSPTKNVKL